MKEQIKALSKETFVYGLSTVVGRFLNFLLVPFYVNVLHSTAEYGISTSLYTYIGFLNVIYPLGLEAAFFRYGARAEGAPYEQEREQRVFSTPFFFLLLIATFLSIIIFFLAPIAVKPVFFDSKIDITPMIPTLTTILRYGAGILFFDTLTILPFAVLRLEHQALRFAGIRLTGIIITLILNFIFILGLKWGVRGIFLANLIASGLVFVLLLPTIKPRLTKTFDKELLKKFLSFGITNVPAYLSSMMVQVIDRPIVQAFLGLSILGIYQANYRMGFVMMIFVGLFEYAWRPFFMRQALKNDQEARLIFSRIFTYFMLVALLSFLALSWGLPIFVSIKIKGHSLLKPEYFIGLKIIPVVLLAYVFQGMYTNFIAGIYIKEKNKSLPLITGVGAAVNIIFNIILIPRIGIMGAALATLFAYMAMAGYIYLISQKVYPIRYEWKRIRLLALVVLCSFCFDFALTHSPLINTKFKLLMVKFFLFITTIDALFTLGFFSEEEINFFRELFTRKNR